jgi:chemotaxis receptor (MCP) glutamine deamidase CheD
MQSTVGSYRSIIAGEVAASGEPLEIRTVLGSCIAACLFDPEAGIGGMNHFMLPDEGDDGLGSARYGTHAMELLINQIMQLGGKRKNLRAKIFGGADVLSLSMTRMSVGQKNVEFVQRFLDVEGIPIVAHRLRGNTGLRVHFFTATAKVLVAPLNEIAKQRIRMQEEKYRIKRAPTPPAGDITLF